MVTTQWPLSAVYGALGYVPLTDFLRLFYFSELLLTKTQEEIIRQNCRCRGIIHYILVRLGGQWKALKVEERGRGESW